MWFQWKSHGGDSLDFWWMNLKTRVFCGTCEGYMSADRGSPCLRHVVESGPHHQRHAICAHNFQVSVVGWFLPRGLSLDSERRGASQLFLKQVWTRATCADDDDDVKDSFSAGFDAASCVCVCSSVLTLVGPLLLLLHRLELKLQLSRSESDRQEEAERRQTVEDEPTEDRRWLKTRWARTCRLERGSSPNGCRSPWTELRRRWAREISFVELHRVC